MTSNFPKGKNGFQCLGPCKKKKVWSIHPHILLPITQNYDYCPSNPFYRSDKDEDAPEYGAECTYDPFEDIDNINNYYKIGLLDFSCDILLKIYNINNMDDSLNFITQNHYNPINTKKRVVNCALKIYGSKIEIIDFRLIDFLTEYFKKTQPENIYNKISKYIIVDDKKITIGNDNNNGNHKEKIKYINDKFINTEFIKKFLTRYINKNKDKWEDISDQIENLSSSFIDYIEKKILLTIK